jgi:hypothetical protein
MTDLLDGGGIELEVYATPPEREEKVRYNPEGLQLGVCRVCGDEAASPQGTYCADHKTRQPRGEAAQPAQTQPSGTATVKRTRSPSGKGAPTADEWNNKLFRKVVGVVTDVVAANLVRRYQINDPTGEIAEQLSMTDDEAANVARPLGRAVAGSQLNRRIGRKVLDNSDLLDAGFALYDWYDRVNKTLQGNSRPPLASVHPIANVPTSGGEDATSEPEDTGGYNPPRDFPPIHGSHFV